MRLFNTPFEIGFRALILLQQCSGKELDMDMIMFMDYLALNSSDAGGPESLNAPIPNRGVQVYSKRELLQKGLAILIAKELIRFISSAQGFTYRITEAGSLFLNSFNTKYFHDLVKRFEWTKSQFGHLTSEQLKSYIDEHIQSWGNEFLDVIND